MQRWRGLEDIPEGWGRSVVTIGSYDGVHRGHQLIIGKAVERAREQGLPVVVVTFDPHPSEVVRPGTHPPLLAPHHRRAELMVELGVDAVLVLPFTKEFSKLSPADFVVKVLVDKLHAQVVVEGPNFRFGHKATGNVDTLAELGKTYDYTVEVIDLYERGEAGGGEPFSSTLARRLIAEGDVAGARRSWGGRTASRASSYGVPSAAVNWASRRPTWRPCRTPRSRPTGSTRACCTSRARRCRRPSRSAPTRSSTARCARSRRTRSTASGWTCTACTSGWTSSRTSAARRSSTPSTRCWSGWRST